MAGARKTKASRRQTSAALQPRSHPAGRLAPVAAAARARKPLSEVLVGESVEVVEQGLAGEEASLLSALGIVGGSRLVVRASGDPCIVEVRAARVGIARRVAAKVIVQSVPR
jgi:Fe2+ transport system protein FeoA